MAFHCRSVWRAFNFVWYCLVDWFSDMPGEKESSVGDESAWISIESWAWRSCLQYLLASSTTVMLCCWWKGLAHALPIFEQDHPPIPTCSNSKVWRGTGAYIFAQIHRPYYSPRPKKIIWVISGKEESRVHIWSPLLLDTTSNITATGKNLPPIRGWWFIGRCLFVTVSLLRHFVGKPKPTQKRHFIIFTVPWITYFEWTI